MTKTLNTTKYKLLKLKTNYHAFNNSIALSTVTTDDGANVVR